VRANPEMGALNVMKEVGYAWQSMTSNDRQYFQDKADKDKIRYLREQKQYYDEVERIGNLVGTIKRKDGNVNVANKIETAPEGITQKRQAKIQ
jgi:hypothetical protein